jgi:pimeloyl-ACP methyl ester carboxylesterase
MASSSDRRRHRSPPVSTWVIAAALLLALACVLSQAVPSDASPAREPGGGRMESARSSGGVATGAGSPAASPVMSGSEPPYVVRTESLRLFDPSRPTPARGGVPATSGRLLVTDLYVPIGAGGARPLVVFAHGWNSDPGVYIALLDAWAAAGFLVAAPVFPDSTDLYSGTPVSDYSGQALDISFVITSLLHDTALPIDPTRIAVAGHSDGGTDVALMALDPTYADARVRAYVCMSGEMPTGVDPYTVGRSNSILLVAVGTNDEYGLYPRSMQVFDMAQADAKAFVAEPGGNHLGSFVDATPAAAAIRAAETQFLELALEPQSHTSAQVAGALDLPAGSLLDVSPP